MKKKLIVSILALMVMLLAYTAFAEARELRFYLSETNSVTADIFNMPVIPLYDEFSSTSIGITALVDYRPLPNLYLSLKSINIFNTSVYRPPFEPYIFLDATYLVNDKLGFKLTAGFPGSFYGVVEYKFVANEKLDLIAQLSGGYSDLYFSPYVDAGFIGSYSITPKLSLAANLDFRYIFKYSVLDIISELTLTYDISDYFNILLVIGDFSTTIYSSGGSSSSNFASLVLAAGTGMNLSYQRKHSDVSFYDHATKSIPELVLPQLLPYYLFDTIFNNSSYYYYIPLSDSFRVSYNLLFQTSRLFQSLDDASLALIMGGIYDISNQLDVSLITSAILNGAFNQNSFEMAIVAIANYEFIENWVASLRIGFHAYEILNDALRETAYSFAPQIKYSLNDDLSLKLTSSFGFSKNSFYGIKANLNLEYRF